MSTTNVTSFSLERLHEAPLFKQVTDAVKDEDVERVRKALKKVPDGEGFLVVGELTPHEVMLYVWVFILEERSRKVGADVPEESILSREIAGVPLDLSIKERENLQQSILAGMVYHFFRSLVYTMLEKRFEAEMEEYANKYQTNEVNLLVHEGFVLVLSTDNSVA